MLEKLPNQLKWQINMGAALLIVGLMASISFASKGMLQDRRITEAQAVAMSERAGEGTEFPVMVNDLVLKELNAYLGTPEGREFIKASLERMENYREGIEGKIKEYGVPTEFLAIPLVESGYRNLEQNERWGAGLWMFIQSTARAFGLTVNDEVDERLDVDILSDAAMRYLLANKLRFNDWQLAVLAYNVGESNVQKAIEKAGSRDVWNLSRTLYENGNNYYAKFMAVVIILKNPDIVAHSKKDILWRSQNTSITVLAIFMCLCLGCVSRFSKKPAYDSTAPEIVSTATISNDIASSAEVSETQESAALGYETCTDTPIYGEEEAALSTILNLYEEALEAIDKGDYSLAETRIDSAAVLSSGIDISVIEDESLALRYMNTLASLFQDYGRIFRDVDKINRESPLDWLDQLAETKPEDFKNGKWTDDELRQIVRKIALRCDVPIEYNERVKKAIYFFQTKKKKTMAKWIRRSGRYMPVIKEIFEAHDLPLDLACLAMIESGFNPRVDSRTHNSGLWQFGSATGRMYGLKRNQWYDQRDDPVKSTKAAARYLNDLYEIYGDWLVVMAAYNGGPARINRQIRIGNRDFWSMNLTRETENYVPSFMAAVIISKAPDVFGFESIQNEAPLVFDTVEIPYMSLQAAAECAGVDLKTLKELNTELIKSHTPVGQDYSLKIPVGSKERFLIEYVKLPKEKYLLPKVDSYYVKRGDTLSGVAAKFRVSVNAALRLKMASGIKTGFVSDNA